MAGTGASRKRRYRTIKEYAIELLLRVSTKDADGRHVGLDYVVIRKLILKRFPIVSVPGPHTGKPTRMAIKKLREIGYELNRDGLRLPMRPRRRNVRKSVHGNKV